MSSVTPIVNFIHETWQPTHNKLGVPAMLWHCAIFANKMREIWVRTFQKDAYSSNFLEKFKGKTFNALNFSRVWCFHKNVNNPIFEYTAHINMIAKINRRCIQQYQQVCSSYEELKNNISLVNIYDLMNKPYEVIHCINQIAKSFFKLCRDYFKLNLCISKTYEAVIWDHEATPSNRLGTNDSKDFEQLVVNSKLAYRELWIHKEMHNAILEKMQAPYSINHLIEKFENSFPFELLQDFCEIGSDYADLNDYNFLINPYLRFKVCDKLNTALEPYQSANNHNFTPTLIDLIAEYVNPSKKLEWLPKNQNDWYKYIGDVGEVPPLPEDIDSILKSPCPFIPGKTVEETHFLILIPATLNGTPLTLRRLERFLKREISEDKFLKLDVKLEKYKDRPFTDSSYWVLLSKQIFGDHRFEKKFGDRYPKYDFPTMTEAFVACAMSWFSNDSNFPQGSNFTQCRDKKTNNQFKVGISGVHRNRLCIKNSTENPFRIGFLPVRRLSNSSLLL